MKWRFLQVFAVFLWSSAFVGIRYSMQDFSAEGLALFRYLIASICMVFIFFSRKHPKRRLQEILPAMFLGVFGFSIYNILLNQGERFITASIASFLNGLSPVLVALLAIWIYKELFTLRAIWGFTISLLGIGIIMINDLFSPSLLGIILTSLAIASGAIYVVLQKRMTARISPIEFTSYAIWGGTIA